MNKPIFPVLLFLIFASCKPQKSKTIEVQEIQFPGSTYSSLPVLSSNPLGDQLLLSWVSKPNDSTAQLFYASLEGDNWSDPLLITEGQNWFVNWADFPAIVENKGSLLSHILQKSSPATFSYDVKLQVLPKGEKEWRTGLPLHSDSTQTEHGFVSAMAYTDTSFFVSWLDGRNTGGGGHEHAGHSGAMSIRASEVTFGGKLLWDELLDAKTCDCCQTSSALTEVGPVVVYRNRSDREIRDIAITRLVDSRWTEPKIIHADGWEIAGCPVNGPKVVAKGKTVLVGWFTAPATLPQVKIAFSTDNGENFEAPITIESKGVIGRVDLVLLDYQTGIVSWMETVEEGTFLRAAKVGIGGEMGTPIPIAAMDPGRKSGFPQLELHGDRVYFAWTEVVGDRIKVKTAFLEKDAFLED